MIQIKYPWLRGRAPCGTEREQDYGRTVQMELSFWDDYGEIRTLVYRTRMSFCPVAIGNSRPVALSKAFRRIRHFSNDINSFGS